MGRIRSRIALVLAAAALSSVFVTASPAAAQEGCYPYPEQYCNTMEWVRRCVFNSDPWCQT